jgi:release factor glutamine methyltransferase
LARRADGEPLQHIVGVAPFWGVELEAGPGALVPRPETERLVELALADLAGLASPAVLDLGTGGGAIAVAIARERPDAEVWAADVDEDALALARRNVVTLAPSVRLVRSDLFAASELRELLPRLDLLTANLPYLPEADASAVPPEVRRDPPGALFGGPDGLDPFRRAWAQMAGVLADGAAAWFELDPRNVGVAEDEVRAAPAAAGREIRVEDDLAGRARFLRIGPRRASE